MSVVFDLGMNDGADTRHYLKRGFTVVAVEANPFLCDNAYWNFPELGEHRLFIVNAAISHNNNPVEFYLSSNNHWSSTNINWAKRGEIIDKCVIDGVTLDDLIHRFGIPTYLKVDVEGADELVLNQLLKGGWKPQYVSVEDCRRGFEYFEILTKCGYTKFKLSDQSLVPPGTSGPLGDELPGEWLDLNSILKEYTTTVRDLTGERIASRKHWWDIHATY